MKGKTHDLNHDLTFSAHTINCVCHNIRSMFRVLDIYNFGERLEKYLNDLTSRTKNYLMRLGNVTKGKKYVDVPLFRKS